MILTKICCAPHEIENEVRAPATCIYSKTIRGKSEMSNLKILCTLGPASFDGKIIKRLEGLGVGLFRINLSHTKARDLSSIIDHIQSHTSVPICLDTEGAQVRTGDFVAERIELRENSVVLASRGKVPGDQTSFNFYPNKIVDQFQIGDFISIDFNSVLVQVIDKDKRGSILRVVNGGVVGQNKAVTVDREIELDPLTENDLACLKIGKEKGLNNFALSFASSRENVDEIRRQTGENDFIISKIESLPGLAKLGEIAERSDALLIDRGDLSRQVPIERIPEVQKAIIKSAKDKGRKVYVATNLLESMITQPTPTRAEVNDIYNTLLDGANGLVLAAETAIGAHPIACAAMVVKMIQNFERPAQSANILTDPSDSVSLLIEPHGGHLVQSHLPLEEHAGITEFHHMNVSDTVLLDCEQITHGTYSPLSGFMDSDTCMAVLENSRLPNGLVWPMPILLPAGQKKDALGFRTGERVALAGADGVVYGIIDVTEIFSLDLDRVARKWFGTSSRDHPGVARLYKDGDCFIAGPVSLVERLPSSYRHYELTPGQTRFIFAHKGWSKVVGFHTRNPVHRGHEHIQIQALRETGADGLYINPVIGPKKSGDFQPGPIMLSYQTMLEFGLYPAGQVALGSFATYSRYAGPREAVFTALCRKNMGCSHFIIGRDHTGVGDYYTPEANRDFIDSLGDLGIQPVFFDPVGYNPDTAQYEPFNSAGVLAIDGTRIRNAIRDGSKVPDWMMRDIVQDALVAESENAGLLFAE
jgi:pyruvate kinase